MATPMIEQFPKGKLNKCWHYIDLCKYVHPELTGTIDRMRDMLIRYTLIKPWPLRGDAPECFHVRFLPKEQNDFFFYYGLGYGLEAQMRRRSFPRSISIWKRRSSIAVSTMYDKERSIKMVHGEIPACRTCPFMELTGRAKMTANNRHTKGTRGDCMCKHPDALETFNRVCPRSPRLPGFIGFTAPGENVPQIKTAPRWCPLRIKSREASHG